MAALFKGLEVVEGEPTQSLTFSLRSGQGTCDLENHKGGSCAERAAEG